MFLWLQLILLVLVGTAFVLLLRTYRKQNAIEESFLCSIGLAAPMVSTFSLDICVARAWIAALISSFS